jgi:hypothetical protein
VYLYRFIQTMFDLVTSLVTVCWADVEQRVNDDASVQVHESLVDRKLSWHNRFS